MIGTFIIPTIVGQIQVMHHLHIHIEWNGWTVIGIMAKIYDELVGGKFRMFKEASIPHLNTMERKVFVSRNTTGTTPEVWSKAILAAMCARGLHTIRAQSTRRKQFMSEQFYEYAVPSSQILFEELVLSLLKPFRLCLQIALTVILTFPWVLECLGSWSDVEVSQPSVWNPPGDHIRFLEGDTLREGDGNCSESLTGTCVILVPRRVCIVVTSNMSDFGFESLIFGI